MLEGEAQEAVEDHDIAWLMAHFPLLSALRQVIHQAEDGCQEMVPTGVETRVNRLPEGIGHGQKQFVFRG